VRASKDHPSAQAIYDRLKPEMPSLSLGNVYRNIAILLEEGRLQSGEFGNGTVRYDAVVSGHYHFVCERCGGVSDFAMAARDEITEAARRLSPHRISGHTVRFYGICAGCLGAEEIKANKRR
jgi:Fur family peroxide stress response transcriptional regulator